MFIVRPIKSDDLPELLQIAQASGAGFTSLPVNENLLRKKIVNSEIAFNKQIQSPKDEGYLMVLEDTDTGKVVGTSAIEAAVGMNDAFYHYRLGKEVYYSEQIEVRNEVTTLTLCHDYTGAAELCTLFLLKNYRRGHNGKLLSRSRFLLLADHYERFGKTIIAEMRGVADENGESPFYGWLQEHFLGIDFPQADYLSGVGKKSFMGEMMPRHPIYVSFLPLKAQQAIGHVHQNTVPALKLLESEGFRWRRYVDIFDGGPTMECNVSDIAAVKNSQKVTVIIAAKAPTLTQFDSEPKKPTKYLIANTRLKDFRATVACANFDDKAMTLLISPVIANALNINEGDKVRILSV